MINVLNRYSIFQVSIVTFIAITLSLLITCRENSENRDSDPNTDGDLSSQKIAGAMQSRLKESLGDTFAKQFGAEGSYDGDQDQDFEDECCLPNDPCLYENDQICQCSAMHWDLLDCENYSDTVVLAKQLSSSSGVFKDMSYFSDPYCSDSVEACEPIDAPSLGDLIDELELGWFDTDAPKSNGGPSTLVCFASPYELKDTENQLNFGIVNEYYDVAALTLTLEGVPGHGMLPVDACGQAVLPGLFALCGESNEGGFSIKAKIALVTFGLEVGDYLEFELEGDCKNK